MDQTGVTRVHYFTRQFLRTQDFEDEQSYQISMRRRHNIAHHGWGIVSGLQPVLDAGSLYLQPGMAVDAFGRELILTQRQALPVTAFVDKGSDTLDVWLAYDRLGSDSAPSGYASCESSGMETFYRWQEQPQVYLEAPDPAYPDPRQPKGVLLGDTGFDATRTPPDDPQRFWPVFLGRVSHNSASQDQPYSVDLSARPYAGLVGEAVVAPSGRARVQVGSEQTKDKNRFAVFIPSSADKPQFSIGQDGSVDLAGDTTVHGKLAIAAGSLEFGVAPAESPLPWHVYRYLETAGGNVASSELRIEIDSGSGGLNQLVVGSWSEKQNKFVPALTVADDGTVTVHGDLVVEGTVSGPTDATDPTTVKGPLTPAAQSFVTGSLMAGAAGASALLAQEQASVAAGSTPAQAEANMRAVALGIHTNPGMLASFVNLLKKDFAKVADELHQQLRPGGP
jgi:hypothetical protein